MRTIFLALTLLAFVACVAGVDDPVAREAREVSDVEAFIKTPLCSMSPAATASFVNGILATSLTPVQCIQCDLFGNNTCLELQTGITLVVTGLTTKNPQLIKTGLQLVQAALQDIINNLKQCLGIPSIMQAQLEADEVQVMSVKPASLVLKDWQKLALDIARKNFPEAGADLNRIFGINKN
eukprot:TRINITY_DN171_c0_g1_i4.p1 TRINITY_DN171_c0_g1~~TRINITY_DN171_c0_g1_i4.p1  ORF type:complete len:181 (+),score=71.72 TRINITY_DN171_c0_g1_i4:46-588(+)